MQSKLKGRRAVSHGKGVLRSGVLSELGFKRLPVWTRPIVRLTGAKHIRDGADFVFRMIRPESHFKPSSAVRSKSSFFCVGCLSTRGLEGTDHDPPPRSPKQRQPVPVSDVPGSLARMYVPILLYPPENAHRAAAPYKKEHAFFVPSVQRRVTSSVIPSSRWRETGRPIMTTPTIFSPNAAAMLCLCPTTGL